MKGDAKKRRKEFPWKTDFPGRKSISAFLVLGLLFAQPAFLSGCGAEPADSEGQIELVEPVGTIAGSELVSRRTLYDAQVYEVLVEPRVEEYCYEESRNFLSSDVNVGDTVKAGDVLYRTDITGVTKQLEKLEERLAALTKSYEEEKKRIEEDLYVQRLELERLEEDLEDVHDMEPENHSGPEYAKWLAENKTYTGMYNKKELDVRMNEEALRQSGELYLLDYDYYYSQIEELRRQNAGGTLRSAIDGQVVKLEYNLEGEYVSANQTVAAVADMNVKLFSCDGLNKSVITTIKDSYLFVNGKKYRAEYCEEESVYSDKQNLSTFVLKDPENEVPVGSYGRFVIFTKLKEQVVAVPREALHINGADRYVYVTEDGKTISRAVKTGISDGFYTEVLSGVEEGETILIDRNNPKAVNTVRLEKTEVSLKYSNGGSSRLIYPLEFRVTTDIENGEVYFDNWAEEVKYARLTRVEAGMPVAYIHVEGDRQELFEKEVELKRAKERLADLIAEGTEGKEKTIESRQEAIKELEEEVGKIQEDLNTTVLRIPRAGLLTSVISGIYDNTTKKLVEIKPGNHMNPMTSYVWIADESVGYLFLPEDTVYGKLGYNTMLTFSYTNMDNETVYREAPVINVDGYDYYGSQALLLNKEIMQDINYYPGYTQGMGRAQTNFYVTGTIKVADNVVLLPAEAIKWSSGNNKFGYVNVLGEDGTITPTAVLVGGKHIDEKLKEYYWVIEGVTEGMTVCWE